MTPFIAEFIGTFLLLLLGDGVVANVVLSKTKGNNSGWIVITFGWAIAVFVGVFVVAPFSGAHINPAVTLGLALTGSFDWALVPSYMIAQFLGGALGSAVVWLHYRPHFAQTDDTEAKLAVFCTGPAIRNTAYNLISEIIGTFVLVFSVLYIAGATVGGQAASLGALDALPVGLLVLGIGLCLGGTTGYAINPARDLGPRLMHAILPVSKKGDSDWSYAWIPVVGPFLGAVLAGLLFVVLN